MGVKRGDGVLAAGMAVAMAGAALTYFGSMPIRARREMRTCQYNLKLIVLATSQYVRDWDEGMPPARSWSGALMPYARDRSLFLCPSRGSLIQGLAMHSAASYAPFSAFEEPVKTVTFFDSNRQGMDSSDFGAYWPSPARHRDSTPPLSWMAT